MDQYTTEEMKYKNGFNKGYQEGYEKGKQEAVKHARWEYVGISDRKKIFRCTYCKTLSPSTGNYCHDCGAKMDGGANA